MVSASSNSPGGDHLFGGERSGPPSSGNTVTVTGMGVVTLQASQAATANYTSARVQTSFTVNGLRPIIVFVDPGVIHGMDTVHAVRIVRFSRSDYLFGGERSGHRLRRHNHTNRHWHGHSAD